MVLRTDALAIGVLLALASLQPGYARWNPTLLGRAWSGPLLLAAVAAALGVLASEACQPGHRADRRHRAIVRTAGVDSLLRPRLPALQRAAEALAGLGRRALLCDLPDPHPAFYLSRELCFRLGWDAGEPLSLLAISLVLIVVLSELNYRFVESPCRDLGSRLVKRLSAARRVATTSGATSC